MLVPISIHFLMYFQIILHKTSELSAVIVEQYMTCKSVRERVLPWTHGFLDYSKNLRVIEPNVYLERQYIG